MFIKLALITLLTGIAALSQTPPIGPGVSHDLAKWRAAHYSDVRYKLNLTLEKMSPVLKGTMEIRVNLLLMPRSPHDGPIGENYPIILDWRKIASHEKVSTVSNVSINGIDLIALTRDESYQVKDSKPAFIEENEHLRFGAGVKWGENVIKLDFTSPILTSGSAITRYVDKEDGAEYIYSLFVPSDASTAFPVFDQPDLKARFSLSLTAPREWTAVSNATVRGPFDPLRITKLPYPYQEIFQETKPISTYVFAFAAGPFAEFDQRNDPNVLASDERLSRKGIPMDRDFVDPRIWGKPSAETVKVYVRKSQAEKFKPHYAEVFRLNREGITFLESYFDYKFPFPKYDIVLIPEFPFGGMEHAGATFLREDRVIFPQEPTANDYITRANVIFHEAAHQWFGNTVTMKWFDDLWLKEGFAEFMAYKTLEKVMPEYNAWKVFYERNKQAAYLTDSTKGTTPIYQEIANLNSAKSAYGNIVYRKAPSFLKQAEFYLGPEKFKTAVRSFLKKYEYANAGWEDLVKEFEAASGQKLTTWADGWIKRPGLPTVRYSFHAVKNASRLQDITGFVTTSQEVKFGDGLKMEPQMGMKWKYRLLFPSGKTEEITVNDSPDSVLQHNTKMIYGENNISLIFPNYQDYGYGIFLLDDKSRDYVLKNIGREKDDFLRTMMWGTLWDSVREAELDPKDYVELVIKNLPTEQDETTVATLLNRVGTAMTYYMSEPPASADGTNAVANTASGPATQRTTKTKSMPPAHAGGSDLNARLEALLIDRIQNASTAGQRITFYRALVSNATTERSRDYLKRLLKSEPPAVAGGLSSSIKNSTQSKASKSDGQPPATAGGTDKMLPPLRVKDRFDIVTRLLILGDPAAPALLDDLIKTNTTDEAKRYAFAARAAIPTKENREKFWNDFVNNKEISESWIEAAAGPFNSIRHDELSLPYLERALRELPNLKRTRKIFFINNWLAAFIAGQRSEQALAIINKFLADNPNLDKDLRLKILENSDLIERAVRIRKRFSHE